MNITSLMSRIRLAQDQGIVVSIMLFEVYGFNANVKDKALWDGSIFNRKNNLNGIDGDKNGEDIGANIPYRYQDGVLTEQPLWNPATGESPHGAIVAGVNDVSGASFDVHQRLQVNPAALPLAYGVTEVIKRRR